jgi:hypothetical protein
LYWAASVAVENKRKVAFWTWTFTEFNTLGLVTSTFIIAATIINWLERKVFVCGATWDWSITSNLSTCIWNTSVSAAALVNLILLGVFTGDTLWFSGTFPWSGLDVVGGSTSVCHTWLFFISP